MIQSKFLACTKNFCYGTMLANMKNLDCYSKLQHPFSYSNLGVVLFKLAYLSPTDRNQFQRRAMAYIRGIYQIPSSRQTFLILSGSNVRDNPKLSLHCLEGMEMLWATLRYKDRMLPKECLKSSVRIVRENDFLTILRDLQLTPKISSNPSTHNPVDMELLAINLLNSNPRDLLSPDTPKVISAISSEDIIEVFI